MTLYFRFTWPSLVTDEELAEAEFRYEGRMDFGLESIDDWPKHGPLIILKARSLEDARAEAAMHWWERTGLDPAGPPPEGYMVFDQTGLIQLGYERANDN